MPLLTLLAALLISSASAQTPPQNVMEYVAAALKKDRGFSPAEQSQLLEVLSARFADYAHQIVPKDRPQGVQVVMRMIIEGSFDQVSMERMADVSFAAYQAISRGAPPDVVEGIALYGYRKQIDADRISDWSNGYKQMTDARVPPEVASDLVRNAMEHDWDRSVFDIFKWSLVHAARERFDLKDYATYLLGNYLKGDRRPGEMTLDAQGYFKKLGGRKPELPAYEGVFSSKPVPQAVYEAKPMAVVPEAPPSEPSAPQGPAKASPEPVEAPKTKPSQALASPETLDTPKARPAPAPKAVPRPAPAVETEVLPPAPSRPKTPGAGPREAGLAMDALWPGLEGTYDSYLGTPYVWGGVTHKGIDCSGLTSNTYGENKVSIPRVSRDQWKIGQTVEYDGLKKGDLVFFNTLGVGVSHVGMVVGNSKAGPKFVQASSSHGVVVSELEKNYYKTRYLGARRVVP